jgi:hypothetical protein
LTEIREHLSLSVSCPKFERCLLFHWIIMSSTITTIQTQAILSKSNSGVAEIQQTLPYFSGSFPSLVHFAVTAPLFSCPVCAIKATFAVTGVMVSKVSFRPDNVDAGAAICERKGCCAKSPILLAAWEMKIILIDGKGRTKTYFL